MALPKVPPTRYRRRRLSPKDGSLANPTWCWKLEKSFELPASGRDIYWNFIFTPDLTARRWVRAIEIRPGQPRVVHHANLLVDRAGSAQLQETAPGKAFLAWTW